MRLLIAFILLIFLFLSTVNLFKVNKGNIASQKESTLSIEKDEEEVVNVVKQLFDISNKNDSVSIKNLFFPQVYLNTVSYKEHDFVFEEEKLDALINNIKASSEINYKEQMMNYNVKIYGNLAVLVADYQFFNDNEFQFCGTNVFQLSKTDNKWKIFHISDFRRNDSCEN